MGVIMNVIQSCNVVLFYLFGLINSCIILQQETKIRIGELSYFLAWIWVFSATEFWFCIDVAYWACKPNVNLITTSYLLYCLQLFLQIIHRLIVTWTQQPRWWIQTIVPCSLIVLVPILVSAHINRNVPIHSCIRRQRRCVKHLKTRTAMADTFLLNHVSV